jgi:hypothetical protein
MHRKAYTKAPFKNIAKLTIKGDLPQSIFSDNHLLLNINFSLEQIEI